MKVFLSHKMSGLPEHDVYCIRTEAYEYLTEKYGNCIAIVDNYHHDDAPPNAGRLWHLGKSIQMLDNVDAIYFVKGHWLNAKGCLVERFIARVYGLKILK